MSENKPVLISLDAQDAPQVADAPVVPDMSGSTEQSAMHSVVRLAARRPSVLARLFWGLLISLLMTAVSITAFNALTALLAQNPVLGLVVSILIGVFAAVCLVIALRELLAFARLRRMDQFQKRAKEAVETGDLTSARKLARDLTALYRNREGTEWGRARLAERLPDAHDVATTFTLVNQDLLTPLDEAASREVEAAARQVATVTALVPLALADVLTALVANLRMIRRIAEIYAGRSGTLGNWRLTRAVMTHLMATGAVAVGDDLISSVAGGSVLGKISRRFGEGVVNGALTARVGVAAIEVCRPLPFEDGKSPRVTGIVKRALTGLFSS